MSDRARIPGAERRRFVAIYRGAARQFADTVQKTILVPATPKLSALESETRIIQDILSREVGDWSREQIQALYRGNLRWFDRAIQAQGGQLTRLAGSARDWSGLHDLAVDGLLHSPDGLIPRLDAATRRLGDGVREFVQARRELQATARATSDRLLAALDADDVAEVRKIMFQAAHGRAPLSALELGADPAVSAFRPIVEAPFVRQATVAGERAIHLVDYAETEMLVSEAVTRTKARKNRADERSIDTVQVSPNPPLTPDICAIYAGRIFATTEEAAEREGVPLMSSMPNGGPPFHPRCLHSIVPYVGHLGPGAEQRKERLTTNGDTRGTRTVGGVPTAALGKDFRSVTKWFKEKGGMEWVAKQNPAMGPLVTKRADKKVKDALKGRK